MDKEILKARVGDAIERRGQEIMAIGRYLLHHPELGFKEIQGAALVAEQFGRLGLAYRQGLALSGIRAEIPGRAPGPTVAVLGELDALICASHPLADPQTGAAHT